MDVQHPPAPPETTSNDNGNDDDEERGRARIVELLETEGSMGGLTGKHVAATLGATEYMTLQRLRAMAEEGKVLRRGSGAGTRWFPGTGVPPKRRGRPRKATTTRKRKQTRKAPVVKVANVLTIEWERDDTLLLSRGTDLYLAKKVET